MGDAKLHTEVVQYGGQKVKILERANGFFSIYWRELRKARLTTRSRLDGADGARAFAKVKVRELAGKAGMRAVPVLEAEAVEGFKGIVGGRSLPAVVDQLKDLVSRMGGFGHLVRACENYLKAGHGRLDRSSVEMAVSRFLAGHAKSAVLYRGGMRKELEAGVLRFGTVSVCDIDAAMLEAFVSRANEDGSEPGARYFNNRLATWKTFLNCCRQWGMLLREEPHAGEVIKRRKEADRVPEIWGIEQAASILKAVAAEENESLNYLVTGCWMGLRPFEMRRVTAAMWDWEQGYLNVGAHVAMKTMQQRFVPIPPNVRELLYERMTAPVRVWGAASPMGRRIAKHIVRADDQAFVAKLLRAKNLITEWPQDVMRHSYISYRLAQGHGRGQVAEWAGNSESEIRKSYRRPLRKEDGDRWFEVRL
jgi:integrase